MNSDERQKIVIRIEKLERVTVKNGATSSEEKNAQEKISQLRSKYNITKTVVTEQRTFTAPSPNIVDELFRKVKNWRSYPSTPPTDFDPKDKNLREITIEEIKQFYDFGDEDDTWYCHPVRTVKNGKIIYEVLDREFRTIEEAYLHVNLMRPKMNKK